MNQITASSLGTKVLRTLLFLFQTLVFFPGTSCPMLVGPLRTGLRDRWALSHSMTQGALLQALSGKTSTITFYKVLGKTDSCQELWNLQIKRQCRSPHVTLVTGEVPLWRNQGHCFCRPPLREKASPFTANNYHKSLIIPVTVPRPCCKPRGCMRITLQSISSWDWLQMFQLGIYPRCGIYWLSSILLS